MNHELQPIERGRDMALRIIEELPFIVGEEAITESKKYMALAFGAASPQLLECTEESIGLAIALSAMSGLYPGGLRPDIWLIPRKNRHKNYALEVNWQMASRGYQRLARMADYDVTAHIVHHHDLFEYEESEPRMEHRPDFDKEGTWETLRLGYVKIVSDAEGLSYRLLRKDQIEKRRKCAQDDSFWTKWPEEKTLATLYGYAGAREAWPTNPQARYAMAASERMESRDLVTLHEPDGRPLLAADIAPEVPAADPVGMSVEQVDGLKDAAKKCGFTLTAAFKDLEWNLPENWGNIPAAEYDGILEGIRLTGIDHGGCGTCGIISESDFCSPECDTARKEEGA